MTDELQITPRQEGRRRAADRIAAEGIKTDPAVSALAAKTIKAAAPCAAVVAERDGTSGDDGR